MDALRIQVMESAVPFLIGSSAPVELVVAWAGPWRTGVGLIQSMHGLGLSDDNPEGGGGQD